VAAGQRFSPTITTAIEGQGGTRRANPVRHIDLSPRRHGRLASGGTRPPGAVQNKVTDAAGAEKCPLTAALGHACGCTSRAADHLAKHPEFAWYQRFCTTWTPRMGAGSPAR